VSRVAVPVSQLKTITSGHPGGILLLESIDVDAENGHTVGPAPAGGAAGRWFGRVLVLVSNYSTAESAVTIRARSPRMADLRLGVPPSTPYGPTVIGPFESADYASADGRFIDLDFAEGFTGRITAIELPRS
jgi:hypothetical protein